jgi:hypothetical protein
MKLFLKLLFAGIFIVMVLINIRAMMQISLLAAIPGFAADPWAVATLYDAYCGFITFFCWVCYKERSVGLKVLWFVLIMGLGNIAMSFYVLMKLFTLKDDEPASALLTQRVA